MTRENTLMTEGRTSPLARELARQLAETEYRRFDDLLRTLTDEDWRKATDCAGWDVFAMASHCLGMAKYAASPEEAARQQAEAFAAGGVFIDSLTALQVREGAQLSPGELTHSYAETWPAAAAGRAGAPTQARERVHETDVHGVIERWTVGYLIDVILTRDVWMHRVDICRATGRPMELSADHDGVLIADVVDEWAERHGQPFTLILDGPAGGTWAVGENGPQLHLDAVEFCRILSGRATGDGLLTTEVPF